MRGVLVVSFDVKKCVCCVFSSFFVLCVCVCLSLSLLRLGLLALLETVLETTWDALEVAHAAGTLSATTLGLGGPVKTTHLLVWITTRRAERVLDVEGDAATTHARCVRLGMALTHTVCTLGLFCVKNTRERENNNKQ
jgi:hypothetical protein